MLVGDAVISGMLRTLESLITLQMANRDHLLVRQCPGLLLYRPLSPQKPGFTGGVRAEIRDQNLLRKFEDPRQTFARPMVFASSLFPVGNTAAGLASIPPDRPKATGGGT